MQRIVSLLYGLAVDTALGGAFVVGAGLLGL